MEDHTNQSTRFKDPITRITSLHLNGQWLKHQLLNLRDFFTATWLDCVTILTIAATAVGVWVAPHTHERLFPVIGPDGAIYRPELAYPYVEPIFSSALAGALTAAIPIFVFLVAQLWVQSFVDFGSAILGLTYSMVTGTLFQVILKKTIGGLRPHFLSVCQPILPPLDGSPGQGYMEVMYTTAQVCQGDAKAVNTALESFPSGHAQCAFSGLGFLAIYLFAHLRIADRSGGRRASYWRMLLVIAPLLFATYLASTLVLGYHHHGYDVLFGAFLGSATAVLGYRMVFRGVLDGSLNTVPYLTLPGRGEQDQEKGQAVSGASDLRQGNGSEARLDAHAGGSGSVSTASQRPVMNGDMV